MVSLFFVQNGKKERERQFTATFLLSEGLSPIASKDHSGVSYRSLTEFPKESDCS